MSNEYNGEEGRKTVGASAAQATAIERIERSIDDMHHLEIRIQELIDRVNGSEKIQNEKVGTSEPRKPPFLAHVLQTGPSRINDSSEKIHAKINELTEILLS